MFILEGGVAGTKCIGEKNEFFLMCEEGVKDAERERKEKR